MSVATSAPAGAGSRRDGAPSGSAASGSEASESDGRRLRRERNRRAVVDALLDLYNDGNLRPSATEIAERAGLSPRSLFRYFDDVDDLSRAAVARQQERAAPLVPLGVGPDAPVAAKIDALVAGRMRLFGTIAPAATVSRIQSPFQPVLAGELAKTRAFLRDQVAELFAPELAAMDAARAASVLAAADVLCSFESHQLLRHDQRLGPARLKAALAGSLAALLAPGPAATAPPAASGPSAGAGDGRPRRQGGAG